MKKLQSIIYDVLVDVRKDMEKAILMGANGIHYEREYGDAYIDVEIYKEKRNNYIFENSEVLVNHIDTKHKSPLLEQAIKDALPSWFAMQKDLMEEERLSA